MKKIRIACIATHPIQYHVPLYKRLALERDVCFTVLYRSRHGLVESFDPQFGIKIKWDTNLTDGYKFKFLPAWGRADKLSFWRPFTRGLFKELIKGRYDIVWIQGYGRFQHVAVIPFLRILGCRVLLRDDPHYGSRPRNRYGDLKSKALFWMLRNFVSGFLCVGSANRDYFLARGVPRHKTIIMPYAVDNGHFSVRNYDEKLQFKAKLLRELGLSKERKIFLYVGKFIELKNCDVLLKAFSKAKDELGSLICPILLMVGAGIMEAELRSLTNALELNDAVYFLGFKNQNELPDIYKGSDIFVLPSKYETWGLSINEAMAAGCSVITTSNVGASFDLVETGKNGYVCDSNNVLELANCMVRSCKDEQTIKLHSDESRAIIRNWTYDHDVLVMRAEVDRLISR
jgi:glycosyltransferase involved in cell wall biosynthesis